MRPYEQVKGTTDKLHKKWVGICKKFISSRYPTYGQFKKICRQIIREFDNIPITDEQKPKVGIVGEILVKFLPAANNHLVELLEAEGAEAVMPDLIDFLLYCFYNSNFKAEALGMKKSTATLCNMGIKLRGADPRSRRKRVPGQPSLHAAGPHRGPGRLCQSISFLSETRPVRAGS